jgi:hypothetical protein
MSWAVLGHPRDKVHFPDEEEGEGKFVDPTEMSEASHVLTINTVALTAASASTTSASAASSSSSNPFPGHEEQGTG